MNEPLANRFRWLNRTVLGMGLASLFSDWSHEIATAVRKALLAGAVTKDTYGRAFGFAQPLVNQPCGQAIGPALYPLTSASLKECLYFAVWRNIVLPSYANS